jgi:SAM-dependent methyltransferase
MLNEFNGTSTKLHIDFTPFLHRYCKERWRAPLFHDMIVEEIRSRGSGVTMVDIGCGRGFDGELQLQESLARHVAAYIGIEPDSQVSLGPFLTEVHHSLFEESHIRPNSVDIAFAVMVLEHIPHPALFWEKLWEVLVPGGVFWGFTVDARHWFCSLSKALDRLKIKDFYLDHALGRRGQDRYENYPVYYRCNTPSAVSRFAAKFRSVQTPSFNRIGNGIENYLPRWLAAPFRPVEKWLDRRTLSQRNAGLHLIVRAVK